MFYHLFRLHRGHPVNWINYRRGCVVPSFTTLARPIWNETITLGFKIQQFIEVNGLHIVVYGFSLSVESLRACVESFERGLIDKLTHAIQANVCDGAAMLSIVFMLVWIEPFVNKLFKYFIKDRQKIYGPIIVWGCRITWFEDGNYFFNFELSDPIELLNPIELLKMIAKGSPRICHEHFRGRVVHEYKP